MAGLLAECTKLFGTDDLYSVLSIAQNASEKEVKKAYHKISLKVHPDRVTEEEKELATKKFQALGKIYSVLSDKDKRGVYDETGEVDDEMREETKDWGEYWRVVFAAISLKDIKDFEATYRKSGEELNDLKAAYLEYEGNFDGILDSVLCCSYEDEPRFRKIIQKWIKEGEVPAYDAFTKEDKAKANKRKRKAEKEAKAAEEMVKEKGMHGDTSLQSMILQRNKSRAKQADSFFDHLEKKYSQPDKKKKKSKK